MNKMHNSPNSIRQSRLDADTEVKILRQVTQMMSSTLELEKILKKTIEMVRKIIRGDACLLYIFDELKEELTLRASDHPHPKVLGKIKLKVGEGITGWVAREKRPVAITQNAAKDPRFKFFHSLPEDRYQAFLSVPIINKDRVVGVINVQHRKPHQHSENEIALLSTIARQVGGAVENARLYEETSRKAEQLDTLSQISKTISSGKYLEEILQLIVTITAKTMNSKVCSLMLLDEKKGELVTEAIETLGPGPGRKSSIKITDSLRGRVVEEKKPVFVPDVQQERGYTNQQLARKEDLHSLLSVPMLVKERVIGVINIYTGETRRFTKEEIKILQTIANQAAVAIEHTKLMEDLLRMKETLETRKAVERAKGILMEEMRVSENEAYKIIRRKSMDTAKPMREIAEAIILTWEMRKKQGKFS
jgi:signal transduction protein with GAF and PtsI domain